MSKADRTLITDNFMIDKHELSRLQQLVKYENLAREKGYRLIAGIDEAGRGPLAGPVVAAACIIPDGIFLNGINDSKKLSPKLRAQLFERITSDPDISYAIAQVDSQTIDTINIYQATIQAMLQAVQTLKNRPDYLLVDGLLLPHPTIPAEKIIKGDALSQSIAAASILAKVTRDRLMQEYHDQWPLYGFNQHKGYPTRKHLEAIQQHGLTSIHRVSYEPVKLVLESTNSETMDGRN